MEVGEIVKIYKTGNHIKPEWVGFTSEITSWFSNGFTMLYGNKVRKEYSDMNFFDQRCVKLATDEEIRIYKEVLPSVKRSLEGVDHVFAYASRGAFIKDIEDGERVGIRPYFNVFGGAIYAAHADSHSKIKVWDQARGLCSFRNRRILLLD